jgi:AbrB family looped-hinge helix DNA binding protein
MSDSTMHEARMSKEGRVLIPAAVRQELGLSENEPLSIYVEDGEVRIVSRLQAIRRMQQRMARHKKPGEGVVDELLRERRAEAKRK